MCANVRVNPPQQLESLVWECSGNLFVSSHSDGGYSVWAVASGDGNNQQPVSSTIPYGEKCSHVSVFASRNMFEACQSRCYNYSCRESAI